VKTKTDEILGLNNVVARLKKELEAYEGESMVQVRGGGGEGRSEMV
jgi:hypothetical protein